MTFIIPEGGKMLHVGKRLVTLLAGDYDTSDKEVIASLELARGVTKKQSKSSPKAPE
jgi:hypothetical protein